ncbi:MAG: hypothetical protein C4K60_15855 [Ideonella sp. MAG2]|nr:MAG: hypothetical protein C4K60_15855 [Ideonella sp. MAG2]
MEDVAQHLQQEAIKRTDPGQRDEFARSAFNRFYYATFIPLSRSLADMKDQWTELPHKDVPELLRGSLIRELKLGKKRAEKLGDNDTAGLCARAISNCHEVAAIMETGYAVRVAADYKSEVRIDFSSGADFKLSNVPVSIAKQWPKRVEAYVGSISAAMRQLSD